jgi:integrase/recombinase XerD
MRVVIASSTVACGRGAVRATFITTALDNGASLEDVQSAAGHADPSTTKLYDRRGYNPEKSASFFANY